MIFLAKNILLACINASLRDDSVINWTKEWLMKLNSNKCKVTHFGNKNVKSVYFIDDLSAEKRIKLETSECERDLGVLVSSYLK